MSTKPTNVEEIKKELIAKMPTKVARKRNIYVYRGEARIDGTLVAEAELSAMIV